MATPKNPKSTNSNLENFKDLVFVTPNILEKLDVPNFKTSHFKDLIRVTLIISEKLEVHFLKTMKF